MKNLYLIITILLFSLSVSAQSAILKKDSTINAFKYYLIRNTRYPAEARENDVQGDVAICFKLGKDKKISEVKIVKALSPECDSGTLRLIRKYTGDLQLPSKEYIIGLHYRIDKGDGKPYAPIKPFDQKLYKRFLFEVNIIGYVPIQKNTKSIDIMTIHN